MAYRKETKQLRYIKEYATAHDLELVKIIRRGCLSEFEANSQYKRIINDISDGKADAILVANTACITPNKMDAYFKIAVADCYGCRFISVDEGELRLNLIIQEEDEVTAGEA